MRMLFLSSVALIHFHYVAWQRPPGSPSSAALIYLRDLAWHHLVPFFGGTIVHRNDRTEGFVGG